MTPHGPTERIRAAQAAMAPFMRFITESAWMQQFAASDISDFAFGNPNELPLPQFVAALQRSAVPQDPSWFAYKWSEPSAQRTVARTLQKLHQMPFAAEDVLMTNGAYAAITVALYTILEPGDEVLFVSPPWFFYEALIVSNGGTPVRVGIDQSFDLDLDSIAGAITERTRAIIVNSPHNPTGKIYPPETLARLARLLKDTSRRLGRTIYIISDEAYSRIVFDGRRYSSPTQVYPHTILVYTYGKTLLTPGQRIGYIALPATMPNREQLRSDLFSAQLLTGFAFPNALLQHALADLEKLSIDIDHLQRKRDRLVAALRAIGYQVHLPEGTFYLLPRSPIADDVHFCNLLGQHKVFCLPGSVVEMPGYFRISLTATDAMIDRALPGFAAAFQEVT